MARKVAILSLLTLQLLIITRGLHGTCCSMKCNPRASVGCIGLDMSDPQQCMEVACPEIHVESCTNPCRMTTQSFSVPKSCCCAPYCTLPGPQTVCTTTPMCGPNCGQAVYRTSNDCQRVPRPPPPPPQQMQRCGCYMPMPYYSPQMPQPAAPSYCVQSVVVGGKAVAPEKSGEENAGGTQESPAGGNPGNTTGFGGGGLFGGGGGLLGGGGLGAPQGRLGPGGLALDPGRQRLRDPSLNLGGGGLGGLPPALRAALPHLLEGLRIPGLGGLGGGVAKYENYLEKILDAINDKLEPSCVGPSPMVVMPQTCTPRVRVKKVRRKQRRKYMIESCEEPDVIVEEEEEDRPSYVLAAPFCPSRSCCCRPRRCGCRSCCY